MSGPVPRFARWLCSQVRSPCSVVEVFWYHIQPKACPISCIPPIQDVPQFWLPNARPKKEDEYQPSAPGGNSMKKPINARSQFLKLTAKKDSEESTGTLGCKLQGP